MKGNCGRMKPQLGKEAHELPGNALDIVLPAHDDKPGHLVRNQHAIFERDLVLHTVQPLGQLEVERTRLAPADGRGQQHHVRPVNQRLINLRQLVGVVHHRDGARPCTGLGTLGVIALAGAELQVCQFDQPRLATQIAVRVIQGDFQQRLRGRIARVLRVLTGGGNADDSYGAWLTLHRAGQGVGRMWGFKARGRGLGAHEQPPVLHFHLMSWHRIVFETRFAKPGEPMELPVMPRADDVITV